MELTEWLLLVLLTLVGIGALLFASGSSGAASTIGVLIAIAAVFAIIYRIKQYFDRTEGGRH